MKKQVYFLPCDPFIAIYKIKLTTNLHICNREGGKVVTASGDRFIGKGNRTVVCHNVADHGKITDRDTTLKIVKGKTSVCNCIMQ